MKRNELAKRAHENAVSKGFWNKIRNDEHYLMLVITEIAEVIEADRRNVRANRELFEEYKERSHPLSFIDFIKNTIEDEMADIAIRLYDLAGALNMDFEKMMPCRYHRDFSELEITNGAFYLVKGLTKEQYPVEKRIQFGLDYVEEWAKHLGFDLNWHIEEKMKYNQSREAMHGKKY